MGIGVSFIASVLSTFGILGHEFLFYETSLFLAGFLSLGKYLESRAKTKTSRAVKKLLSLAPKTVLIKKDNTFAEIPIAELKAGDIFLTRAGDRFAADGHVISGESYVDESMMTGEPLPKRKSSHDKILGGTINTQNPLEVCAEKVGTETALAEIIRLVKESQASKPELQKVSDRVVVYFIPSILAIAGAAFLVWYFAVGMDMLFSVSVFIAVIVIACPCALGLATPTAIVSGMGRAAELGIFYKDALALQSAEKVSVVFLDKTGTITTAKMTVTEIIPHQAEPDDVIAAAAAAEQYSSHPLAAAIMQYAQEKNILVLEGTKAESFSGLGICAGIGEQKICTGSISFFDKMEIDIPQNIRYRAERLEQEGSTTVLVSRGSSTLGVIGISDAIRPDAYSAIHALNQSGVTVHLLTGDNERTAFSVAQKVGIPVVHAQVMPADKSRTIALQQEMNKIVAFAGDGINDAAALAQADLGIAVANGSDIAFESGSVALMNESLLAIPASLDMAKQIMRRIRLNLFWALCYNIVLVPMAAGALYPFTGIMFKPELAGLAMAASSVTVVFLSLLLYRYTPDVLKTRH